jgi:AcrR family transcriptional regulator
VDNTRINEITEEADVGFGSFYYHFDSKEAIVEAVLEETLREQSVALERLTDQISDPAEVIAVAHRYFVRLAARDPDWGWLIVRLDVSPKVAIARDLQRGVKEGRFKIANEAVTLSAMGGALSAVMRLVLDKQAPRNADVLLAEGMLRLLGLPPEEARQIARRRMPSGSRSGRST